MSDIAVVCISDPTASGYQRLALAIISRAVLDVRRGIYSTSAWRFLESDGCKDLAEALGINGSLERLAMNSYRRK
jgi:hypothetical protein